MIKTFITGFIGNDAEQAQVGENTVLNFSIASNEKGKDGVNILTWMNCQLWNRNKLLPYLKKGASVAVSGRYRTNVNGDKHYSFTIVDNLEFTGRKPNDSGNDPL